MIIDSITLRESENNTSEIFYINNIEVIKNPTDNEYKNLYTEQKEKYPWCSSDEPLIRHTFDENGNEYIWASMDAMHYKIEPYINKKFHTRTSQQYKWWTKKDADEYPISYTEKLVENTTNIDSIYFELIKDANDNKEKIEKLLKEQASKNDYTIKAFHGTKDKFTIFNHTKGKKFDTGFLGTGFYFTDNDENAQNYANWKIGYNEETVMSVYLQIKNPLILDSVKPNITAIQDALGIHLTDNVMSITQPISDAFTKQVTKLGYDGIKKHSSFYDDTTYVVYKPNQIKSADLITYDNKGNVIPISERFNTSNNDIRY